MGALLPGNHPTVQEAAFILPLPLSYKNVGAEALSHLLGGSKSDWKSLGRVVAFERIPYFRAATYIQVSILSAVAVLSLLMAEVSRVVRCLFVYSFAIDR